MKQHTLLFPIGLSAPGAVPPA